MGIFILYLVQNWIYSDGPTFEIIGHGASVCCQLNYMHIKGHIQCNLPHRQRIWFHWHNDNSLFAGFFRHFNAKNGCLDALTFKINGHAASVCCPFNDMNIKGNNQYNLLHMQRIWVH